MREIMLVMMCYAALAIPAFAGEQMTYTDEDLDKYNKYSTYDEETISKSEAEQKRWETEKEVQEKLAGQRREAEDKRLEKEKKTAAKKPAVSQKTATSSDNGTPIIKRGKT